MSHHIILLAEEKAHLLTWEPRILGTGPGRSSECSDIRVFTVRGCDFRLRSPVWKPKVVVFREVVTSARISGDSLSLNTT